jgi:hypothetical protein
MQRTAMIRLALMPLLLLVSLTDIVRAHGASASSYKSISLLTGASLCSGPRSSGGDTVQCFSPTQVTQVEKLLPFKPVGPVETVWHLLHLELTEVAATRYIVASRSGRHIRSYNISYVFGRIPRLPGGMPDFGGQSKYMVMVESTGHDVQLTKPRQVRLIDVTTGGTDVMAVANLSNRRAVTVESNLGRSLIKRVTLAIVAKEPAQPPSWHVASLSSVATA